MRWFSQQIVILFAMAVTLVRSEIPFSGVGASFPAEVFRTWLPAFENYRSDFEHISANYLISGSGVGRSAAVFAYPTYIYTGSEISMQVAPTSNTTTTTTTSASTTTDATNATNTTTTAQEQAAVYVQSVPILAGSVVLAYNIRGLNNLSLTMEHIVGIYNGTITMWNDSSIAAANPTIAHLLPKATITVVARADESGTTLLFTSALSRADSAWNRTYGSFSKGVTTDSAGSNTPVYWNPSAVHLYGTSNHGVSGLVLSYSNTIGYVSASEAAVTQLKFVAIKRNGFNVQPSVSHLSSAMARCEGELMTRFTTDLQRCVEPDEYPIVGMTYFLIHVTANPSMSCDTSLELVRYIEWALMEPSAKNQANRLAMEVVSHAVAHNIIEVIVKAMTCGGSSLYYQVEEQKRKEWMQSQNFLIPLCVIFIIGVAGVIAIGVYALLQRRKWHKSLASTGWRVPEEEIVLKWCRQELAILQLSPGYSRASSFGFSSFSATTVSVSNLPASVWAVGSWREKPICLRAPLVDSLFDSLKTDFNQLVWIKCQLQHENLLAFHGVVSLSICGIFLVSDLAAKGTISDIVQDEKYNIDDNIKFSFALDIAEAVVFLHTHGILHGRLKSSCCLIDRRWNVKVTDFEYGALVSQPGGGSKKRSSSRVSPVNPGCGIKNGCEILAKGKGGQTGDACPEADLYAKDLLWTAPELLQDPNDVNSLKQCTDVYSFAVIAVEIFTRQDPYSSLSGIMGMAEIVEMIRTKNITPDTSNVSPLSIRILLDTCLTCPPAKRPAMTQLKKQFASMKPSKKSVIETMMDDLEKYVNHLEDVVAERTEEIAAACKRHRDLLLQMLPPSVADALSRGEVVRPEYYDSVTIFFSDIVGFTQLSSSSSPFDIVNMLNSLYGLFDSIIDSLDVYKVETIGDSYMVISGLPRRNDKQHAKHIALMALQFIYTAGNFRISHLPNDRRLQLRCGIHSGPVAAGVVGHKMPRYCLFGDTVNTASRMESTSLPMRIQISQQTKALLDDIGGFEIVERGEEEVKGKGKMMTYLLLSTKSDSGYQHPG